MILKKFAIFVYYLIMDCQLIEEKSFDFNCFFLSFDFKRYIGISFHFFEFF